MLSHNKRRWLVFAIVLAVAAVAAFHADPVFGASQHSSFAILPCIGTLALLPSDPGAWITPEEHEPVALDAFVPAVPPRAPPV